ncbi:MAG TPA: glycoside hydrolase family protein [Candidatus Thermoplasmatota archaeon]|nr:glycoside hydrolase family protein [Candidatus Thermoplasmatota archaeon]
MAVKYVPFDGAKVSRRWRVALVEARRNGVRFRVNSGHRTMAEQRALFERNMHYKDGRWQPKPGRPLTAWPSRTAPHIREGNPAHALDVDVHVGDGAAGLAAWLRKRGVAVSFPVSGEPWHMEISRRDLRRLSNRLKRERRKRRESRGARKMSARGIGFLIHEEGFVPYAYNDPAGHATFGVGHLLHHGPVTAADRVKWGTPENPKPRSLVRRVLRRDLRRFERAVREAVNRPLKQHEFDALVSLAFNIGVAGFQGSTVVRELNAGRRRKAARAILMWNKPAILKPRRRRERRLFLRGYAK